MLRKEKKKKIVLGKIYEAIQLHRVKDCITGRNSQKEKSIKIFLLLYIVCILFYILMRLKYLIKYVNCNGLFRKGILTKIYVYNTNFIV